MQTEQTQLYCLMSWYLHLEVSAEVAPVAFQSTKQHINAHISSLPPNSRVFVGSVPLLGLKFEEALPSKTTSNTNFIKC